MNLKGTLPAMLTQDSQTRARFLFGFCGYSDPQSFLGGLVGIQTGFSGGSDKHTGHHPILFSGFSLGLVGVRTRNTTTPTGDDESGAISGDLPIRIARSHGPQGSSSVREVLALEVAELEHCSSTSNRGMWAWVKKKVATLEFWQVETRTKT